MYIALHYKGIIAAVHWLQVFMQSSLANKYIYIYIYIFIYLCREEVYSAQ